MCVLWKPLRRSLLHASVIFNDIFFPNYCCSSLSLIDMTPQWFNFYQVHDTFYISCSCCKRDFLEIKSRTNQCDVMDFEIPFFWSNQMTDQSAMNCVSTEPPKVNKQEGVLWSFWQQVAVEQCFWWVGSLFVCVLCMPVDVCTHTHMSDTLLH